MPGYADDELTQVPLGLPGVRLVPGLPECRADPAKPQQAVQATALLVQTGCPLRHHGRDPVPLGRHQTLLLPLQVARLGLLLRRDPGIDSAAFLAAYLRPEHGVDIPRREPALPAGQT